MSGELGGVDMGRVADMERTRICLDCERMEHDPVDYECGRCPLTGRKIDHLNNHLGCSQWAMPEWRKPTKRERETTLKWYRAPAVVDG